MCGDVDLYCKIFVDVDVDVDKDSLARLVAELTGGSVDQWTVLTAWGSTDVVRNSDFDKAKRAQEPDGFLYYHYCLEVEPAELTQPELYIQSIGSLLMQLWRKGINAVAACAFEDRLPRMGGYDTKNR